MAEIYRDGDGAHWKSDPYDLVIEEQEFSKDDLLELPLAAGGGAAVRFRMAE
jgi:alpha-glucosidase